MANTSTSGATGPASHADSHAGATVATGTSQASASGKQRTVPITIIHEQEVEKARDEIAKLVAKAREIELTREDPLNEKPEYELLKELQDLFRQVHHLNAKWLADVGYEWVPPPAPLPQNAPDAVKDAPKDGNGQKKAA